MSAGLVMAVSGLLMVFDPESFGVMRVFWFETAAISAFGVAWFVKGAAYRERVAEEDGVAPTPSESNAEQ